MTTGKGRVLSAAVLLSAASLIWNLLHLVAALAR